MTGLDPPATSSSRSPPWSPTTTSDRGRGPRPGGPRRPRRSWPPWTTSCGTCTPVRACSRRSRPRPSPWPTPGSHLGFLREHLGEPRTVPLAGNSIGTDRRFLAAQLPEIEDYLHYRSVDVSTLKELAARWYPEPWPGRPEEADHHRAMDDIKESVAELAYYRTALFSAAPTAGRPRPPAATPSPGRRAPWRARDAEPGRGHRRPHRARADLRDGGDRDPGRADPGLEVRPGLAADVLDLSLGHGDADFLVYEDERTSFAEHYRIAATLAHRLRDEFGVGQGDRVAIAMRNLPEWVMAFWADRRRRRGGGAAQRLVDRRGAPLRAGRLGTVVAFVDEERAERIRPRLTSSVPAGHRGGQRAPGPPPAVVGRASASPRSPSARPWARWPPTPSRRPSTSTPTTTPPSSTPRAPPGGPRARWAPTATPAPT